MQCSPGRHSRHRETPAVRQMRYHSLQLAVRLWQRPRVEARGASWRRRNVQGLLEAYRGRLAARLEAEEVERDRIAREQEQASLFLAQRLEDEEAHRAHPPRPAPASPPADDGICQVEWQGRGAVSPHTLPWSPAPRGQGPSGALPWAAPISMSSAFIPHSLATFETEMPGDDIHMEWTFLEVVSVFDQAMQADAQANHLTNCILACNLIDPIRALIASCLGSPAPRAPNAISGSGGIRTSMCMHLLEEKVNHALIAHCHDRQAFAGPLCINIELHRLAGYFWLSFLRVPRQAWDDLRRASNCE